MGAVAKEARVSRATAYRYFESVEALVCEAAMDHELVSAEELFADCPTLDPVERVLIAEAEVYKIDSKYPMQLRIFLAHMIKQQVEAAGKNEAIPLRQNRRGEFIEHALAPVRDQFDPVIYRNLCASLAVFIGTEPMIVFQDVIRIPEAESREAKAWAIRSLIERALEDSRKTGA